MAKRYRNQGRNNPQYALWYMQVQKRDGKRCINCNTTQNVYIYNISSLKDYYNVDDGLMICTKCKKEILQKEQNELIFRQLIVERKLKDAAKEKS